MKIKSIFPALSAAYPSGIIVTFSLLGGLTSSAYGQASGDFRSNVTTGIFGTAGSWQSFDGTSWVTAGAAPTTTNGAVNILTGNTLNLALSTSVDQFTIDAGGQLTVDATRVLTLANGTGTDMTISGTLLYSGATMIVTGATWTVLSGGTYIHNTTSGISTPLGAATLASGSNFVYRGSSTVNSSISVSSRTYSNLTFESSSGVWNTSAFSGSGAWTVNGTLTVGTGVGVNYGTYSGTTSFAGDVTVSGTLGATNGARAITIATGKTATVNSGGAINMASTQTLTIATGGTLAGAGSITGTTSVAGKIAPGVSGTGTLTVTGALTLSSSIFDWDITSPTANGANDDQGTYDKVVNTSGTTLSGTSVFNVVLGSGKSYDDAFWDTNKSWTDVFTGTGVASLNLKNIFTSFTNGGSTLTGGLVPGQGTFSFAGTGNTLNWTAVPEPSSALAGLLLGAGLLRRNRSQRA